MNNVDLKKIGTENRNPNTMNIDKVPTNEILKLINNEDKTVPYVYVDSKAALGRACGVSRDVIAVAIISVKDASAKSVDTIKDEIEKLVF